MRIVPIRYTADAAASKRFYLALGLSAGASSRPGAWVELPAASGMLALHSADIAPGTSTPPPPALAMPTLHTTTDDAPGMSTPPPPALATPTQHTTTDDAPGTCELAFEADEPLQDVAERLREAGFEPGPVLDENHGQSLRVRDPDGVWVQINLLDRELYT